MRTRVAEDPQVRELMLLIEQVQRRVFEGEEVDAKKMELMFRLMKELAIYLNESNETVIFGEENEKILNQMVSNSKIYMQRFSRRGEEVETLYNEYRIFYLLLIVHPLTDINGFIESRNVGELYCLIDDCLYHQQSQEIIYSLRVILKMLQFNTNSPQ